MSPPAFPDIDLSGSEHSEDGHAETEPVEYDGEDLTPIDHQAPPELEEDSIEVRGIAHTSEHPTKQEQPSESIQIVVNRVDYTVEYSDKGTPHPRIHMYGRDPSVPPSDQNDDLEHVVVRGFRPYLYIPTKAVDDLLRGREIVENVEPAGESIRGTEVSKVTVRIPRDVREIRSESTDYEADIPFPRRFLLDTGITQAAEVPNNRRDDGTLVADVGEINPTTLSSSREPRVLTLDIEVDDRNGFPNDGAEPIICLTTHDSRSDEYICWLVNPPDQARSLDETLPDYEFINERDGLDHNPTVRVFESEPLLLEGVLDYVDKIDPDVLTAWNVEFDAGYLYDRLGYVDDSTGAEFNLNPDRLSRLNEVWDSGYDGPNIKGRSVFDLLEAYKRQQFTEQPSYRLDAIGEQELGVGKETYIGDLGDLWETDPEQLLEYNLRDVEICVELAADQDLISFWNEVAGFVGCQLSDAPVPSQAVDTYVLRKAHGKFVLPSRGHDQGESVEGGSVFEPITDRREMVAVLDLRSLYPMVMKTLNASPETKVGPKYDGDVYTAPNGARFQKEPDGIIREMVDELLAEREEKKRLRNEHSPGTPAYEKYDRQQAALKVVMNSLFGVLLWDSFRLYDQEIGEAVTATSRAGIRHTEDVIEDQGYNVIYGDTDSCLVELDGSKQEAIDTAVELESVVNDAYDDFATEVLNAEDHYLQIEFEKLYRRFLQAGKKKRYAGHVIFAQGNDVDKVDITGFEYKRSDVAEVTKQVQHEVITQLVLNDDIDEVREYLHKVIDDFETGQYSISEIGMPKGLGKHMHEYDGEPAHVRGAKRANLLFGANFTKGSKPKRLYLSGVDPDYFVNIENDRDISPRRNPIYADFKQNPDIICFEYAEQVPDAFRIDWDTMLTKTLQKPISRVLEAVDVSWESVRSQQRQLGLEEF